MLHIGTHQSSTKGFLRIGKDALSIGADTFQFFLRNPRGTGSKALDIEDAAALRAFLAEHAFAPVVAHAPYTLNACSPAPRVRELAVTMLAEDLAKLQHLPGNLYAMHPGSHGGSGVDAAAPLIAEALNASLRPDHETMLLLETMSGKGSEVGKSFAELKAIIDRVVLQEKVGVCFDACHLFASGHDIVNRLDEVLESFDRAIGLDRLRAFHLNDSMHPFGSRKDRHASIGGGHIGLKAIVAILTHPALASLSFITETPLDLAGHAAEMQLLRAKYVVK